MLNTVPTTVSPQDIYSQLMASHRDIPIRETLAQILSSWLLGLGALPNYLGLKQKSFEHMMALYFPDFAWRNTRIKPDELNYQRSDEAGELRRLLMQHRHRQNIAEQWMADIVVAGCMGANHLWQDLGLWNRLALSQLMQENFTTLAVLNSKDMKWKKFLYKQLCESEGIYVCRSPSCEACSDYQVCFGTQD